MVGKDGVLEGGRGPAGSRWGSGWALGAWGGMPGQGRENSKLLTRPAVARYCLGIVRSACS